MIFKNPYITELGKIQTLQRWIIFHSLAYYEFDVTFVSDSVFDNNCQQLLKLMNKNPHEKLESRYAELFYRFDGNTGFYLAQEIMNDPRYITLYDVIIWDISILAKRKGIDLPL